MKTTNANQVSRNREPAWIYLREYSSGEFEFTGGLLFQTIRDLGVPPDSLAKIEKTLAEFTNEMVGFHPEKLQRPLVIRLFCQEKILVAENLSETASQQSEECALEHSPMVRRTEMNAGWGYFLIKRAHNSPAGSPENARHFIDLYLYKEGE